MVRQAKMQPIESGFYHLFDTYIELSPRRFFVIARRVSHLCMLSAVVAGSFSTARADEPQTAKDHKALTKADIDEMMTSLSNWGRWGKDDQRGTLNLITDEKRKQAAALVKEGAVVSLAHRVIKEDTDSSTA